MLENTSKLNNDETPTSEDFYDSNFHIGKGTCSKTCGGYGWCYLLYDNLSNYKMNRWQEHNDQYSSAVLQRFREVLEPAMAGIAPDWLLHHMEIIRTEDSRDLTERVEIRLVIKPLGSVRQAPIGIEKNPYRNADDGL